jgi:serine/threonine-protein kinase
MGAIPLVAGALEGRETAGFGVSRDTLLFQAAALPIVVPSVPRAAPVGVLVATKLVDRQMALDFRAATSAEVIFYALDAAGVPHVAATSLEHASDAAAALPRSVGQSVPKSRADSASSIAPSARSALLGGVPFAIQGAGLTTAGGEIVGGFVVARPENASGGELTGVRRSLLAAGALGLVLALGAAWSSARRVTRPARALAAAASHALEGNYDDAARHAAAATAGVPASEVATLGAALGALVEELREKQALGALVGRPNPGQPSALETIVADDTDDERDRRRSTRPLPRVSGARGRGAASLAARQRDSRWSAHPTVSLPPGAIVADRFEIQDVLGVGGSGVVYRVTDRTLGETVALKMLRPELVTDDPHAREELKRELRLTRRISHRNVVRTYDFGISRGVPFLSMEYVEGTSLASVIAHRGALPEEAVVALAKQLTRALTAAHQQGIMHGDLKPANLLVALDGLLKVTDFGVASLVRRPRSGRAVPNALDDSLDPPQLAGAVVGTPEYMAPELLVGGLPDVRTDLYAAGMVLHECLTGATPFQRDTPRAFLAQKLDPAVTPRATPVPIEREPRTFEAIIAWMTAADPSDRPSSAAEVGAQLR